MWFTAEGKASIKYLSQLLRNFKLNAYCEEVAKVMEVII
jgi:hypothetical protein